MSFEDFIPGEHKASATINIKSGQVFFTNGAVKKFNMEGDYVVGYSSSRKLVRLARAEYGEIAHKFTKHKHNGTSVVSCRALTKRLAEDGFRGTITKRRMYVDEESGYIMIDLLKGATDV